MIYPVVITIKYIPLLKGNKIHTKQVQVTQHELEGINLMVILLKDNYDITVTFSDGTHSDYIPTFGDYMATVLGVPVSFSSLDLINGIVQICLLLGLPPSGIIHDILHEDTPIEIDFGYYFGSISLSNQSGLPDGSVLDTEYVRNITVPEIIDSAIMRWQECFPGVNSGIMLPSELYFISTNSTYANIAAVCVAAPNIPDELGTHINTYYISNVCSGNDYRGKGLSKSVLVCMINNLINKGIDKFLLEVLPTNTVAYNLYTSLGFRKIPSGKTYDVLLLDL